MSKSSISKIDLAMLKKQRCASYRRRILEVSQQVQAIHAAPAFSCTEIVDTIYNDLMSWNNTKNSDDTFLMSKGHGCLIQYVILEEKGILTSRDIEEYCTSAGRLGAHPDYGTPGISAATGSLGHGLGLATGMAYADKLQKKDGKIFLVLSDGECQEGSTWEGAMMAANLELNNLITFIDLNDFGGLERMSQGHSAFYPLNDKFTAFGWEVLQVNGHKHEEILMAYESRKGKKPLVIICNTVKGKGVSYMENVPIWHYRSPNKDEYKRAIAELSEV